MWGKSQFNKVQHSLRSLAVVLGMAGAGTAGAATYAGNGAAGFGGQIGNGTLTVTDNGTSINFSLAPGGGSFTGNDLVLYLDTQPGGVNNNSTFSDNGDGGRTAISGANNGKSSRSLVTFAPGFGADKAISVEPSFAGLFDLSNPSNFTYLGSGNIPSSGAGPYTFSYTRAALGLGPKQGFSFEGTLISTDAYRSNETIGTSITLPALTDLGSAPNAGYNGSTTFTSVNTFAPVPVPAAAWGGLALIGLIGAGSLVRRICVA